MMEAVLDASAMDVAVTLAAAVVIGEALMLAVLLVAARGERREHGWLVVALTAVGCISAGDVIDHLHLAARLAWTAPFTNAALLAIGPALWSYARVLTARGPGFPHAWLHWLPATAAFALFAGGAFVESGTASEQPVGESAGPLWILVPVAAQMAVYLLAIAMRVRRARARLREEYSSFEGRSLSWLLFVAALFGGVLLTWVLSWAAGRTTSNLATNLLSGLVLVVMGVFGARQRNVFGQVAQSPAAAAAAPVVVKYARSAIDETTARALIAKLEGAMKEDRPYLESDLTLGELAQRLGATPHQLSQVFTQHLGMTFFDYVNRHRVDAVRATLARPAAADRSLLEIALECGFGSKSTFNDTFRRHTGMSPGEYRRRHVRPGHA